MAVIWIFLALMTLLALAFVLLPLFRSAPRTPVNADDLAMRKDSNVSAFRQRMSELEQEKANGQWNDAEFERLSTELKRNFLSDMAALEEGTAPVSHRERLRGNWRVVLPVLVLLPLLAFVAYDRYGTAYDLAAPELMRALDQADSREAQEAALSDLAEFLQGRFERDPGNVEGGYMLGSLYMGLEEYDKAEQTFLRIVDAVDEDRDRATILGQLAQARYLQADQEISPEVEDTIDQALALNPNEQAVMSLLAIQAFVEGDIPAALSYWRRQLNQLQQGSREALMLQQRINQVQELLAESDTQQTPPAADDAEDVAVRVRVDVSAEVRAQVDDSMRVFVFARSTQMPVPLAAQTFTVADLPLELTLDDSMAMMPELTLSSAEMIIVGARISKSGQAIAAAGDFQAVSEPLELRALDDAVTLNISDMVE